MSFRNNCVQKFTDKISLCCAELLALNFIYLFEMDREDCRAYFPHVVDYIEDALEDELGRNENISTLSRLSVDNCEKLAEV